jgi:hypothetical protein
VDRFPVHTDIFHKTSGAQSGNEAGVCPTALVILCPHHSTTAPHSSSSYYCIFIHSVVSYDRYRGADKFLARPTSPCILFDGENVSFDASLVIYIYIYIYIVLIFLQL